MANGDNLHKARAAKNDEFYTRMEDIEHELVKYKEFFAGKRVYLPCDDANWSKFWYWLLMHFYDYGMVSIEATCYHDGQHGEHWKYSGGEDTQVFYSHIRECKNNFGEFSKYCEYEVLEGDGDFRSPECTNILMETDLVVTNPPFSLFREFVAWIGEKDFIIIGNKNALTYKEIFPMIKENKVSLGYYEPSEFDQPKGDKLKSLKGLTKWFTSLDINKRHIKQEYYSRYDKSKYPHYDNYDAIEVSKSKDIPCDWTGIMGVPITWLDQYCVEQFEILDINPHFFSIIAQGLPKPKQLHISGQKDPYARILIRWKPEAMPSIDEKGIIRYS